MTCIVAALHQAGVVVCADTIATGDNLRVRDDRKLRRRGKAIIGAAGDGRLCELALYTRCAPYAEGDLGDWLREHLAPAVWKAAGAKVTHELNVTILAATGTQLAAIDDDGAVYWPQDSFHAIGSGAEYAIGAMGATKDLTLSLTDRIERAMRQAAQYADGVAPPWTWARARA